MRIYERVELGTRNTSSNSSSSLGTTSVSSSPGGTRRVLSSAGGGGAAREERGPAFEYQLWHEFQSHEAEFDYLKSLEIEEKINCLRWLVRGERSGVSGWG